MLLIEYKKGWSIKKKKSIWLILLCLGIDFLALSSNNDFTVVNSQPDEKLPNNPTFASAFTTDLVEYWRLDEFSTDADNKQIWKGLNGFDGSSTLAKQYPGKYGGGARTTTSDFISIPNDPDLKIKSSFSIGCWVNMEAYPASETVSHFLYKIEEYTLGIYRNNFNQILLYCDVYDNSGEREDACTLYQSLDFYPLNTWIHVMMTFDFTNIKLYVNGVSTGVKTYIGPLPTSKNGALLIGHYFTGTVDDVRIYDRTLSLSEVNAVKNYEIPYSNVSPITNLVGLWSFEDFPPIPLGIYDGTGDVVLWAGYNNLDARGYNTGNQIGKTGKGMRFSYGSSDSVYVPYQPIIGIQNRMSWGAWVYPYSLGGASNGYFIWKHNEYGLRYDSNGYFEAYINDGGVLTSVKSLLSFPVNSWYHVMAVRNDTTLFLYVNGVFQGSILNLATDQSTTTNALYFGCKGSQLSGEFSGVLDDVRIYNRALTPLDLNTTMNFEMYYGNILNDYCMTNGPATTKSDNTGSAYTTISVASSSWKLGTRTNDGGASADYSKYDPFDLFFGLHNDCGTSGGWDVNEISDASQQMAKKYYANIDDPSLRVIFNKVLTKETYAGDGNGVTIYCEIGGSSITSGYPAPSFRTVKQIDRKTDHNWQEESGLSYTSFVYGSIGQPSTNFSTDQYIRLGIHTINDDYAPGYYPDNGLYRKFLGDTGKFEIDFYAFYVCALYTNNQNPFILPMTSPVAQVSYGSNIELSWMPIDICATTGSTFYNISRDSTAIITNQPWISGQPITFMTDFDSTDRPGWYSYNITLMDNFGGYITQNYPVQITPTNPNAVSNVDAIMIDDDIMISWDLIVSGSENDGGADITGYRIDRQVDGAVWNIEYGFSSGNVLNNWNDTFVDNNSYAYKYRVYARNAEGYDSIIGVESPEIGQYYVTWLSPGNESFIEFEVDADNIFEFEFASFGLDEIQLIINGTNYGDVLGLDEIDLGIWSTNLEGMFTVELQGFNQSVMVDSENLTLTFAKLILSQYEVEAFGIEYLGQELYMILHDPSGDRSFSRYSESSSSALMLGCEISSGLTLGLGIGVKVGAEFSLFGVEAGASTSIDAKVEGSELETSGYQAELKIQDEMSFQSSTDYINRNFIGPGVGDVYWGEVWKLNWSVLLYRKIYTNGSQLYTTPTIHYGIVRSSAAFLTDILAPQNWKEQNLVYAPDYYDEFTNGVNWLEKVTTSGGVVTSKTHSVEYTEERTKSVQIGLDASVTTTIEGKIGAVSGSVSGSISLNLAIKNYARQGSSYKIETGYTLYDDDSEDQLEQDVGIDLRFGTFIFRKDNSTTHTSSPWEIGTFDYVAPIIYTPLITYDTSGDKLGPCNNDNPEIRVKIDDENSFQSVLIKYSTNAGSEWETILMVQDGEGYWIGNLPNACHGAEIIWYLRATDSSGLTSEKNDSSTGGYFKYTVLNRAPIISLTSPNGGEILEDIFQIRWEATDPDNDQLHYSLYYNIDNKGWVLIAKDITELYYDWDISLITEGGKAVLVKVVAEDDFGGISEDESDFVFEITGKTANTLKNTLIWVGASIGCVSAVSLGLKLMKKKSKLKIIDTPPAG